MAKKLDAMSLINILVRGEFKVRIIGYREDKIVDNFTIYNK